MKIWTITTCHTRKEVFTACLDKYYETATHETEHYILDHHYPVDYWQTRHAILDVAEKWKLKVVSNPKNVGGHEGYNWVFRQLPIGDDDFVIGFDSDSWPMHKGWDSAMIQALQKCPELSSVSLIIDSLVKNRQWTTVCTEPNVVVPDHIDMVNVSCWRASAVKKTAGMLGMARYYGGGEIMMSGLGMKTGYLWDYREEFCPIPHDQRYNDWKMAHLRGFPGNFDEYLKTLPPADTKKE